MSFILKYQQSAYERQIGLLEGHLARLQDCYDEMERLRENMFTFWSDENAQTAGIMLNKTMQRVRNEKSRATKLLTYYSSTVEYVSGADSAITDLSDEAFGALDKLGGLME